MKAAAALLLVSGSAWAGSVFLNGVNIDGVSNQTFEKATVRIDDKGNVHIDAPGYSVKTLEAPPAGPAAPAQAPAPSSAPSLTKKYFLVTEQTAVGSTDYDIDLYINAKWIRRMRSVDDQIVADITKHLVAGKNDVLVVATKLAPDGGRRAQNEKNVYRVVVGEGSIAGDNVTIENPVVRYERNAAQSDHDSKQFTLVTR